MNGKPRFNGFMFGVNIDLIKIAAFNHPYELFDTSTEIVGQEDLLVIEMSKFDLYPVVSLSSFCYHFKSATVSLAQKSRRIRVLNNRDVRENLSLYHPHYYKPNHVQQRIPTDFSAYPFRALLIRFQEPIQFYPSFKEVSKYDSIRSNRLQSGITVAFATSGL